ncbi:hypothetical protein Ndes2526B_g00572 [Nannochloris sp. 'desiccata']
MAYSCDFEVEGRVQGVFFRACTEKKAKELGLVGWVMNTPQGTVKGVCQSEDKNSLDQMMYWLSTEGSPSSRIDTCRFSNEREDLSSVEFDNFIVKRRGGY